MESSRPGKPLIDIHGIPMIVHVYLRTRLATSVDEVFVVTDSPLIRDVVESYGSRTIMTGSTTRLVVIALLKQLVLGL